MLLSLSSSPELVSDAEKAGIFVKDNYALKIAHYEWEHIEREFAYGFYASQNYPDLFVRHLALTTNRVIFMERCEGDFFKKYVA